MNKVRDNERALTCTHLVNFIKRHHRHWLQEYLEEKKRGQEYRSLLKLLQLFCARHGFTQQKPAKSKKRQDELEEIRQAFAVDFYRIHDGFSPHAIFNVDETAVTYDMPPNKIWAVRGENSKIEWRKTILPDDGLNLEDSLTAANSSRFPWATSMQYKKAPGWTSVCGPTILSLCSSLKFREPSVLLADNYDSHVSAKGHKTEEQVGCLVAAIPPNAASVVQPLDVGVMAPFKRHLRDLWLQEDLIEGEDGDEEHDVDLMYVSARQKRFAMIARAIKAWSRITPQEIRRSFAKALPS
ncbi:Aste57867_16593 [Aphanomyces stellatus]|uniref:Aste57867_14199 protein n=1 Tax=Aphanomyces stellatus TaxID=120398 RepID=A0A485L1Q2_9STRA|nr:hypothetical protein As57867_016536 [Aphanomyces stellatus]KAF0694944.1 hypothetical protein As57867_014148 [Aphanomyces stellatus]VFT91024.1 Aste57867_14199 [Aphanomyces stellatus]VFT93364.1 Aste57867_16593 [Aphanomyces stellatus]